MLFVIGSGEFLLLHAFKEEKAERCNRKLDQAVKRLMGSVQMLRGH